MPANHASASPFPVRGVPGGWRDQWDDDDRELAMIRRRLASFDAKTRRPARSWRRSTLRLWC